VKRLPNFIEKCYFFTKVIKCCISTTKYLRYQYGVTQVTPSVILHLHNNSWFLTKFYSNNFS